MSGSLPPRDEGSLVGRDRELAILREQLAALAGRGRLVLIGGEAGIGKTALAEGLCREAGQLGARVLTGRCYDLTETPPYGPWLELFGQYRPIDGSPPLPEAFARRGILGAIARQPLLFHQVADWCAALAAVRPVVILLEDLHWADPPASTCCAPSRARSPIFPSCCSPPTVPTSSRDHHPLGQLMPAMIREAPTTRLAMRRLDPDAVHALVAARYRLPGPDLPRSSPTCTGARRATRSSSSSCSTPWRRRGRAGGGEGWRLGGLAGAHIPPLLRQVIDRGSIASTRACNISSRSRR